MKSPLQDMRHAQPNVAPVDTGAGSIVGSAFSSLGASLGLPIPGAAVVALRKAADTGANEAVNLVTGQNEFDRERAGRHKKDDAAINNFIQEQNNGRKAGALHAIHNGMDAGQTHALSTLAHREQGEQQQQALHMVEQAANLEMNAANKIAGIQAAQVDVNLNVEHQQKMMDLKQKEHEFNLVMEGKNQQAMLDSMAEKADQEAEDMEKIKNAQDEMKRISMDQYLRKLKEKRESGGDESYAKATMEAVQQEMTLLDRHRAQDKMVTRNKKIREKEIEQQEDKHKGQEKVLNDVHRDTKHKNEMDRAKRKIKQEQDLEETRFVFDQQKLKSALDIEHANKVLLEAQSLKEKRSQQFALTLSSLGIGEIDMRKEEGRSCRASFTKLFFLTITLACEMDIYGFILAALQYSTIGEDVEGYEYPSRANWLMRALLLTGPVAYLLAIFSYLYRQRAKGTSLGDANLPISERTDRAVVGFNDLNFTLPDEPFVLQSFHFIPIYRCYMLIKDLTPDDVEALFRVNSLSTFTLGFSQMVCLLLAGSDGLLKGGDITMKVVLLNQFFNFVVTMIYYSTTIANQMKGSTKVDAMKFSFRERMQREYVRFSDAINQNNMRRTAQTKKVVDEFHAMAEEEIKQLAKMPEVDLNIFSMEQKCVIRKSLRIKEINGFIDLCKV